MLNLICILLILIMILSGCGFQQIYKDEKDSKKTSIETALSFIVIFTLGYVIFATLTEKDE